MNDESIMYLFRIIPKHEKRKAIAIIKALVELKKASIADIKRHTNLSRAISQKWLHGLEHKGFLVSSRVHNSKVYRLSEYGIRFIEIYKKKGGGKK